MAAGRELPFARKRPLPFHGWTVSHRCTYWVRRWAGKRAYVIGLREEGASDEGAPTWVKGVSLVALRWTFIIYPTTPEGSEVFRGFVSGFGLMRMLGNKIMGPHKTDAGERRSLAVSRRMKFGRMLQKRWNRK